MLSYMTLKKTAVRCFIASILCGSSLQGLTDQAGRLVRLASQSLIEDPQKALGYLNQALDEEGESADLHTYKASLLESMKKNEAAEAEYIIAVQKDAENPFKREQLADFYIRIAQYPKALHILQDTLSAPSLDSVWLKAAFWSRVAKPLDLPVNMPASERELPNDFSRGELAPLALYILSLPQGIYWNNEAFEKLPKYEEYQNTRQETFWLQLIDALKRGDEKLAYELLTFNRFQTVSWAPQVEEALKTILVYRSANPAENGTFPTREDLFNDPAKFLALLASYSKVSSSELQRLIPKEQQALMMNPEVFALPFLAHGWQEAALQLHLLAVIPDHFPSSAAYGMLEALQANRTDEIALDFGSHQSRFAPVSLLTAKIFLAQDNKQRAFSHLINIYKRQDAVGREAALLIEPLFFENGQLLLAKEAIRIHPALMSTVEGRERLARIALEEGDAVEAAFLYSKLKLTRLRPNLS